jgi:hypothetical protein
VINYREELLKEITDIPEEIIPSIFEQIKIIKRNFIKKTIKSASPTRRLLNLSGALENPDRLNARQYKRKVVEDYISNHQ